VIWEIISWILIRVGDLVALGLLVVLLLIVALAICDNISPTEKDPR